MKDFFVSYTSLDEKYAVWIASILEKDKYSVVIQKWDFRPGDNLVNRIHESLQECNKLIIILSENYLNSRWCEAEWTSKLSEQIETSERKVIPIRIEPVVPKGLLKNIIYIDIVDSPTEEHTIKTILNGVKDVGDRVCETGYIPYYNIEYINILNSYYVHDDYIEYVKIARGIVKQEGFNKLHYRVTWFPNEKIEINPLTDGLRLESINLRDTNSNYNIVFPQEIEKDSLIHYSVKTKMTNCHKQFRDFFSIEIISPVQTIDVLLRINQDVDSVYTQKLSSSPMNRRTEDPVKHRYTDPFHWHVEKPELNFEYKVFW